MLNETRWPSCVHPAAGDDDARVLLAGPLDRRSELGAQVLAGHGEQIMGGVARRHAQIAVGRSQGVEALVLAVDQDRGRSIGLEHQPPAKVGKCGLARGCLVLSQPRGDPHAASRSSEKSNSPGRLPPICR